MIALDQDIRFPSAFLCYTRYVFYHEHHEIYYKERKAEAFKMMGDRLKAEIPDML